MIERAKRTEIGRLNFVTLYGILGLVMYTLSLIWIDATFQLWWMAVPVLSYGVPFVYHKMWRNQMTVTGRVVKYGWGLFAWDASAFVPPLMVIVGSCALFMLGGIYKQKAILIAGYFGLVSGVMFITTNGGKYTNANLFSYVFFAYCVYIGLSLRGNVDEIRFS